MRSARYPGLLAAVLALLCFRQVGFHDFVVYDDSIHVYANPHLKKTPLSNIPKFWQAPYEGLYIPVTYTVWAGIAGATSRDTTSGTEHNPYAFHLANLLVHLLSVLVVAALLRRLVRHDWAAFGGALLFALHPLQVEPVAWVSGLKTVLGGFFLLAAAWQYVCYAGAPVGGSKRRLHYALATAAFVLAMLAAPGAVVAPLVAGIIACTLLGRPVRQTAKELLPWLLVAIPVVIVTKMSQPDLEPAFIPALWQRPLIAGDAV